MLRTFLSHLIVSMVAAVCLSLPAAALDVSKGKWIDLTHPFNEQSIYWPTAEEFKKTKVFHGHAAGGPLRIVAHVSER